MVHPTMADELKEDDEQVMEAGRPLQDILNNRPILLSHDQFRQLLSMNPGNGSPGLSVLRILLHGPLSSSRHRSFTMLSAERPGRQKFEAAVKRDPSVPQRLTTVNQGVHVFNRFRYVSPRGRTQKRKIGHTLLKKRPLTLHDTHVRRHKQRLKNCASCQH